MKKRFVDIHQHSMYGVDDGPQSKKKMYAMLDKAAENGIYKIVVTPHVTPGIRKMDFEQYARSLRIAREYCEENGLDITLFEGAEILYSEHTCRMLREGQVPTMAGTDRVLVEFSPEARFQSIYQAIESLNTNGYIPIIAHVERYRCLVMRPSLAEQLKSELEVCFQMNCASLLEKRGFWERRFIGRMLSRELIDALGTDAHNLTTRPINMLEAYQVVRKECGKDYAHRLTDGSIFKE